MSRSVFKAYVIRNKLIPQECSICKNDGLWLDKKLILQLDHIDGNRYNNELNNLRFLCPNCHSQQLTSNRKKPSLRLDLESVKTILPECESKRQVLLKLGKAEANANYAALDKLFREHNLVITKKRTYVYKPHLNERKVKRPSKEELERLVELMSMVKIGKMFGVTDNAVRKWIKYYNLNASVVPTVFETVDVVTGTEIASSNLAGSTNIMPL